MVGVMGMETITLNKQILLETLSPLHLPHLKLRKNFGSIRWIHLEG